MPKLYSRRFALGALGALPLSKAIAGGAIIGEGIVNLAPPSGPPPTCPGTNVITAFGATGNGTTDDTVALQNAANSGQTLYFPNTANFYKITSVITLQNSVCSDGGEVRIAQDSSLGKSIFRVQENSSPLSIKGFILNGLYTTGTAGEASMGIELRSANNITIDSNTIKNCYGDCIYLGMSDGAIPNTDITITNNILTNPRRDCITVIFGDGVLIQSNTLNKTVDYVTGIDLEPNDDGFSYIKNITIDDNIIDCPASCIENCCAFVGGAVPGIVVSNNTATGLQFFWTSTSQSMTGPHFTANNWTCTNPAVSSPRPGRFFNLTNATACVLTNNIDHTVKLAGQPYFSLGGNSTCTESGNTFI